VGDVGGQSPGDGIQWFRTASENIRGDRRLRGRINPGSSGYFQEQETMKSIYVGNLPFNTTEDEVRNTFEQYGEVGSVKLISDRDTGRPRGFGFVEMDGASADAAIQALDGASFGGRTLRVNEARPRQPRY